ncbi:Uncharacterised protein [Serratia liquefaciens]|nr:Uncharacterised protein [Serratia liquefaciens]
MPAGNKMKMAAGYYRATMGWVSLSGIFALKPAATPPSTVHKSVHHPIGR